MKELWDMGFLELTPLQVADYLDGFDDEWRFGETTKMIRTLIEELEQAKERIKDLRSQNISLREDLQRDMSSDHFRYQGYQEQIKELKSKLTQYESIIQLRSVK